MGIGSSSIPIPLRLSVPRWRNRSRRTPGRWLLPLLLVLSLLSPLLGDFVLLHLLFGAPGSRSTTLTPLCLLFPFSSPSTRWALPSSRAHGSGTRRIHSRLCLTTLFWTRSRWERRNLVKQVLKRARGLSKDSQHPS